MDCIQTARIVPPLAALALLGAGLLSTGCQNNTEAQLRQQVRQLEERTRRQENELAARQSSISELQRQVEVARGISADELELIYYPERLEIGRLTGGADYDGQPGDDGVTVFLRPLDREGDIIKVAGDITVQLYDLAAPPDQTFIGEYKVPVEQVGKLWHGKLLTNHYTIKCPFPPGRVPKNPEVTVRVVFVDYLTKRVLSAQTTAKVNVAPGTSTATRPAATTRPAAPRPRP